MPEEIWKPVVGWEGLYEVSSYGRVRSLDREPGPENTLKRRWRGRVMSTTSVPRYYPGVTLYPGRVSALVHRLVCEAFHGPQPEDKPLVLHGDGNILNARADNLRWGSYSDNEVDRLKHGNNPERNKTHCVQGHPYNKGNTYVYPNGHRGCISCAKVSGPENRRRRIERGLQPGDSRHGTPTGYSHWGCKCPSCKEAGRLYRNKRKEALSVKSEIKPSK